MDGTEAVLELFPVVSVLVFGACVAAYITIYVVRRVTPPTRIPVPPHWMALEQRRFYNPGALPRATAAVLLAVLLVGGVSVGPFVLGIASDISPEAWIIAAFVAISVSLFGWYFLRPKWPRCPSCKSTAMEKEFSLVRPRVRIYLCRACQIVWQTTYTSHRRGLNAPPHY